jgi:hypothetical protein
MIITVYDGINEAYRIPEELKEKFNIEAEAIWDAMNDEECAIAEEVFFSNFAKFREKSLDYSI